MSFIYVTTQFCGNNLGVNSRLVPQEFPLGSGFVLVVESHLDGTVLEKHVVYHTFGLQDKIVHLLKRFVPFIRCHCRTECHHPAVNFQLLGSK